MRLATGTQEVIEVDVAFYNNAEKQALLAYPSGKTMEELVKRPLHIPTAEFLTYYLFHRKRLGTAGYRDYVTIGRKIDRALSAIDECLDFNGKSVCTPPGVARQLNEISEHVGEAVGLAVVNRIHGLTEADWEPIQQQYGRGAAPTFDFQIASDGHDMLQLEAKGSSVADNGTQDQAVCHQRTRIKEKKDKLQALAKAGSDPFPAGLRYGTIAVVDSRRDGRAKCWLVDPPADETSKIPRRFRLLRRMRFLKDWICFLSPHSPLAAALATRVAALHTLHDPFELDKSPLLRGDGEAFAFTPFSGGQAHSTFMAAKAKIADRPAGGNILQLSDRALFFIGIHEQLLVLAAEQDFAHTMAFNFQAGTSDEAVECLISRRRFERMTVPASLNPQAHQGGTYVAFRLPGRIHYSPAGLVFGVIPLPP